MRLRNLLIASLAVLISPLLAQHEALDPATQAAEPNQVIIVTGTRRTDRTVLESAVPVSPRRRQVCGTEPPVRRIRACCGSRAALADRSHPQDHGQTRLWQCLPIPRVSGGYLQVTATARHLGSW